VAAAGPAAVIIAGVLAAVLRGLQVQEQRELPGKLAEAIVEAQNQTIVLRDLLDTEIGNQELYGVFLTVTLPAFPARKFRRRRRATAVLSLLRRTARIRRKSAAFLISARTEFATRRGSTARGLLTATTRPARKR